MRADPQRIAEIAARVEAAEHGQSDAARALGRLKDRAHADLALLLADRAERDAEIAGLRARLEAAEGGVEKLRQWVDPDAPTQTDWCGTCAVCRRPEPYVYHVPEVLWRHVLPPALWGEVVCAACFDEYARCGPGVQSTHHADCWRYHPGCAVARLEAVAEVRAGLVERGERCRTLERESSHHEARRLAAKAATYEHAADLLGKALEG